MPVRPDEDSDDEPEESPESFVGDQQLEQAVREALQDEQHLQRAMQESLYDSGATRLLDADESVQLCRMGCGLRVAQGLDRFGNPFTTCCRSCALGGEHDDTCQVLLQMEERLCSMGCGRPAAVGVDRSGLPFTACCRGCALGGEHDQFCQKPVEDVKLCRMGCGLPVAPGLDNFGQAFTSCCRSCARGGGHDAFCQQPAKDAADRPCSMGCGLPAARGTDAKGMRWTTCCRACACGAGHDEFCQQDAPSTDLELAEQLQEQEVSRWWSRVQSGRSRLFEAATCLWDPVWGQVEFQEIEIDDNWHRKKRRQICFIGLFGCCPCMLFSCFCCCRGDIKSGGTPKDVRRGWQRMLLSWSVLFAIPQLASVIIHQFGNSHLSTAHRFDAEGAKNAAKILYWNEWWRLVTPIFLHAGWLHVVGNLAVQLRTALVLEIIWGRTTWLVIYLVSAVVGSLWSCIFSPDTLSVGSSGALCGVVGAWPIFIMITWNQTLPRDRKQRDRMMFLIVFAILLLIGFSFMPMVDWAAHFGGLAAGMALSALIFARRLQTRSWRYGTGIAGAVSIITLLSLSLYYFLKYTEPTERLLTL